jgi:hypothetical protein
MKTRFFVVCAVLVFFEFPKFHDALIIPYEKIFSHNLFDVYMDTKLWYTPIEKTRRLIQF